MNSSLETTPGLFEVAIAPSSKAAKRSSETSAAIKLLPSLVDAFRWNHRERIAEIGERIAAAVESGFPTVSKKLRSVKELKPTNLLQPSHLIAFEQPRCGLDSVVLPGKIDTTCRSIITEHSRRDELAACSLTPRHKMLLYGAPGNGKTMLAEALAHEMDLPFLRVKYSGLIASYLGETGKNVETIMEYARTAPCVLFLNEFDGIGMDRNDNADVGEMRRITNHLLISLERLPATCVFVAATNALGLIDKALKRRFDFVLELPSPTAESKQRCASIELAHTLTPGTDLSHLAPRVADLPLQNLYEVAELCRSIRRDLVLNNGEEIEQLLQLEIMNN